MNEDRTKEKSISPPQSDRSALTTRHPETKSGRKYLVELLMTRKLTQIAAQRQSSGVLKYF